MSTINKILIFFLVISFNFTVSQEIKLNHNLILLKSKEELVSYYSINKDTSRISIGIYINGFESKKRRAKAISEYKSKKKREFAKLQSFSVNFLSLQKPEKLYSISGINYILLNQFDPNTQIPNPTFFIVEQKDGTYLKWKTSIVPIE